jgi:hypothetical protein
MKRIERITGILTINKFCDACFREKKQNVTTEKHHTCPAKNNINFSPPG